MSCSSWRTRFARPGAPPEPPAGYREIAREAALGGGGRGPPRSSASTATACAGGWCARRSRIVVIAASTIAALVIGVGGNQMPVVRTVDMSATSGATASIDFGEADGAVRPVVVKVSHLPPAGNGHYYQLWMSEDGENMPVAAFNTESDGSVTAKATMPADMGWDQLLDHARLDRRPERRERHRRPPEPSPGSLYTGSPRGYSSVGRAPGSHPGGQRFESA